VLKVKVLSRENAPFRISIAYWYSCKKLLMLFFWRFF